MTMQLRDAQRDEFCRVLTMVQPDSPTLCAGWTAFDLAAHVWLLNHGPLSWPGLFLPPFAWLTTREMSRVKERFSYARLIEEIRTGPASLRCMPTDSREDYRHALGEYFIHTEDVRRPNRMPRQDISTDLAEALWKRLRVAARLLHPLASWEFQTPQGGRSRIGRRTPSKRITGEPAELLLWVYGRTDTARVSVVSL